MGLVVSRDDQHTDDTAPSAPWQGRQYCANEQGEAPNIMHAVAMHCHHQLVALPAHSSVVLQRHTSRAKSAPRRKVQPARRQSK